MSKTNTISELAEIQEEVEKSDGEAECKSGESKTWSLKMAQWKTNYHIVEKSNNTTEYQKYSL